MTFANGYFMSLFGLQSSVKLLTYSTFHISKTYFAQTTHVYIGYGKSCSLVDSV